ncbi:MAG TPA: DUF3185 family protein [Candidatus Eisenbacteria bacterium]|nr:DUF3185 family protein [Candidatus Eisenbacteria bacterium]
MNKPLGIAFLVIGIVLLVYGINAADSLASSFSKFFSGAPTDKSIWLMVLGGALTGFGLFTVVRR